MCRCRPRRFSALQRAENSSIHLPETLRRVLDAVSVLFSEPKIPQSAQVAATAVVLLRFSALQRAENSSILSENQPPATDGHEFQCSSASRKFLNTVKLNRDVRSGKSFSALQRAENSSIQRRIEQSRVDPVVSVLFSEPKIPQLRPRAAQRRVGRAVSVLFSEPKIPQCFLWKSTLGDPH